MIKHMIVGAAAAALGWLTCDYIQRDTYPTYPFFYHAHIIVVESSDLDLATKLCQTNKYCQDVMTLDELPKRGDAK